MRVWKTFPFRNEIVFAEFVMTSIVEDVAEVRSLACWTELKSMFPNLDRNKMIPVEEIFVSSVSEILIVSVGVPPIPRLVEVSQYLT